MTAVLYPGDILAVLFCRQDLETFHWTICVVHSTTKAAKYHAKQSGTNWWFEEPLVNNDLLRSQTLAVAVKIGHLDSTGVGGDALASILRPIPMAIPDEDKGREAIFDCRVWWREAIRRLNKAKIIQCASVDKLEEECKGHGLNNIAGLPSWNGYQYRISQCSA